MKSLSEGEIVTCGGSHLLTCTCQDMSFSIKDAYTATMLEAAPIVEHKVVAWWNSSLCSKILDQEVKL